jgi:hypothetical protein
MLTFCLMGFADCWLRWLGGDLRGGHHFHFSIAFVSYQNGRAIDGDANMTPDGVLRFDPGHLFHVFP